MDDIARRTFLRVIETGALSAAAKDLRTDVSTISRRISGLEAKLGIQLIERGPRRSLPTDAGFRYYENLRRLFDEQDAFEAELRGEVDTPRGLLRIASPTNLGEQHVTRWALEFQRDYPQLTIDLILDDRYVDLRGSGVDVAIRIGELEDSSLMARKIGSMRLGLFASADYLVTHGMPRVPSDLSAHDFLLFSFLQAGDALVLTHETGRTESINLRSKLTINNVGAIAQAVVLGAGIHAGPIWLFSSLAKEGGVVQILPDWLPPLYPVHTVHNYGRRPPAKVVKLVQHLTDKLHQLDGVLRN